MNGEGVSVNPARVLQWMVAAGGEAALHADRAMYAVALEDAQARIAELQAPAEGEKPEAATA